MKTKLASLILVCGLLSSCTASYVTNEAIESNKAVEGGTNAVLVTNILRAREGLTPYYSDIAHLRGSQLEQGGNLGDTRFRSLRRNALDRQGHGHAGSYRADKSLV